MSEAVDPNLAKLWTAHRELASVIWGDDVTRDNGLRSEVREHRERLDAVELVTRNLITDLKHYLDKEREETCIGKKLVVAHEAKHKEGEEEEVAMTKTKMTLKATLQAAIIPATIQAFVTIAMILFAKVVS